VGWGTLNSLTPDSQQNPNAAYSSPQLNPPSSSLSNFLLFYLAFNSINH
jgi:hypothetical protein